MNISIFYAHILDAAKQSGLQIRDILTRVKAAGIDSLEMDLFHYQQDTDHFAMISEAGFKVSCVNAFYHMDSEFDLEAAQAHIQAAINSRADKILVVPGFIDENDAADMAKHISDYDKLAESFSKNNKVMHMAASISRLVSMANETNIKVVIEDFDNIASPLSSLNGVLWFLNQIPGLYCCFDTGNFITHGEDMIHSWDVLKDKVIHVHCKDRSDAAVAVGSGHLPMREILRKIIDSGYENTLAIEHYGAENQLECAEKSAAFLNNFIR